MVADRENIPKLNHYDVQSIRAECERYRDQLRDLARIHLAVDPPARRIQPDEPSMVGRMRKVCLHVKAIIGLEIIAGAEHVLATEVRAAYYQMDALWKDVPTVIWAEDMDVEWASEAKNGVLAVYDHPTPQSLMLTAGYGGFRDGGNSMVYVRMAAWMAQLALGYGLALVYLDQVLGAKQDVATRLVPVFNMDGVGQ